VDKDMVPAATRMDVFRKMANESESGEVFVRGDGEVKYAEMMNLMSELGQAGFARVTLVTNVQGGSQPPENGSSGASGGQPAPQGGSAAPASAPAAPAAPPAAAPAAPAAPTAGG
jgi:hypothetical protein